MKGTLTYVFYRYVTERLFPTWSSWGHSFPGEAGVGV